MTTAGDSRPPGIRRASVPRAPGDADRLDETIDDATSISVRRRPAAVPSAGADAGVDEATALSVRRTPVAADVEDPVDDVTTLSTRRRPALDAPEIDDPVDDETAPSSRASAARRASDAAAADPGASDLADDTVLSDRRAPSSAEKRPELEDTILRPAAPSSSAATAALGPAAQPTRDAHVPDAASLRVPVPPRSVPPVAVSRAAPKRPPSGRARDAAPPDHESVERAVRVRDRRRVLVVVLSVTAIALLSVVALVLLLT